MPLNRMQAVKNRRLSFNIALPPSRQRKQVRTMKEKPVASEER